MVAGRVAQSVIFVQRLVSGTDAAAKRHHCRNTNDINAAASVERVILDNIFRANRHLTKLNLDVRKLRATLSHNQMGH